jgi:hypothetical protein
MGEWLWLFVCFTDFLFFADCLPGFRFIVFFLDGHLAG